MKKKNSTPPVFSISSTRHITLTFPKSVYAYGGQISFHKNLTSAEAREVAAGLTNAANELDRAEA